jgi:hypothetical protein
MKEERRALTQPFLRVIEDANQLGDSINSFQQKIDLYLLLDCLPCGPMIFIAKEFHLCSDQSEERRDTKRLTATIC